MMSEEPILNRVAGSGLVLIEMDDFLPEWEPVPLDIAPQLWEGIALREKDFRAFASGVDWEIYKGKVVAVFCSTDAIIPHWAFMLLAASLTPFAKEIHFGTPDSYTNSAVLDKINALDVDIYRDARVVVKGCGKGNLYYATYGQIAAKLTPVVKSLMFGEPCSTVPVFKRKTTV